MSAKAFPDHIRSLFYSPVLCISGKDIQAPEKTTLCGKDTTKKFLEWEGDYVTFLFYADFRRNTSWLAPTTLTPLSTKSNCIDIHNDTNNDTTQSSPCSTPHNPKETTTPPDVYPAYPEVTFRVDVTSFDYGKLL